MLDLPHCNIKNVQVFLEELAKAEYKEYKVLLLGNAAFDKAKHLIPNRDQVGLRMSVYIVAFVCSLGPFFTRKRGRNGHNEPQRTPHFLKMFRSLPHGLLTAVWSQFMRRKDRPNLLN